MPNVAPTERQRYSGVWGVRHSSARTTHGCIECGHLILRGETYWRFYGRMAEAPRPWTARTCEYCREQWRKRYGDDS